LKSKCERRLGEVWLLFLALTVLSQSGCSSNYLAVSSKTKVDLRGHWEIDRASSDDVQKLMQKESDNADQGTNLRKEIQKLLRGSGIALVRQEFGVLAADSMSIEADQFSFGFDYEPGIYRDVSLGRRDRGIWRVYSGWESDVFTVESTSSDIRVVERYLMEAGEKLTVDFMVRADGNNIELKRVFKRRSRIHDKP
jgi:hypothetical protein